MGALPSNLSPVLATYLRRCLEKEPKQRVHDMPMCVAMDGAFETTACAPSEPSVSPTLPVWQRPVVIARRLNVRGRSRCRRRDRRLERDRFGSSTSGLALRAVVPSRGSADRSRTPRGRRVSRWAAGWTPRAMASSLRSLDQVNSVRWPPPMGRNASRTLAFSPDGQWIGFDLRCQFGAASAEPVATSGGAPVALGHGVNPWGASWGSDRSPGNVTVRTDGGGDAVLRSGRPLSSWRITG